VSAVRLFSRFITGSVGLVSEKTSTALGTQIGPSRVKAAPEFWMVTVAVPSVLTRTLPKKSSATAV
jgi:hypothetical protein